MALEAYPREGAEGRGGPRAPATKPRVRPPPPSPRLCVGPEGLRARGAPRPKQQSRERLAPRAGPACSTLKPRDLRRLGFLHLPPPAAALMGGNVGAESDTLPPRGRRLSARAERGHPTRGDKLAWGRASAELSAGRPASGSPRRPPEAAADCAAGGEPAERVVRSERQVSAARPRAPWAPRDDSAPAPGPLGTAAHSPREAEGEKRAKSQAVRTGVPPGTVPAQLPPRGGTPTWPLETRSRPGVRNSGRPLTPRQPGKPPPHRKHGPASVRGETTGQASWAQRGPRARSPGTEGPRRTGRELVSPGP
ncbi:proline-rich protein HaeIII subfamily 1-like [Mesoplodon densirostris]|uniref:proline-rich protein HaeIII subfamily 1-like n=1 Tax=Mesoplodon densirostris TaxID=48708 RepID=UPI0028DC8BFB|nr:proline-rich protein HaeIII subfamily 1-like [Mesoplodon densirostris]